jgi:hypothetical protein
MTLKELFDHYKRWMKTKVTGVVKVYLHEGGIRKVRIEKDVK